MQKGFTLVELIIVIVLLGILAVNAVPKFINASDDARQKTVEQLMGQIQSTVEINRGYANVKGKAIGDQVVTLDEVGDFSFSGGFPQNKSEATSPNLYFFELMNISQSVRTVVENSDTQRLISYGDLASYETDTVSRIGYGTDDLTDGNCYAEYRLNALNVPEYDIELTGC